MEKIINSSIDSKERSVEVQREKDFSSVPTNQPTPSSVDDSNENEIKKQENQDSKVESTEVLRNALANDWQRLKTSEISRQDVLETALQETEEDFEIFSDPVAEFVKTTGKKVHKVSDVIEKGIEPLDFLINNLVVKNLASEGDKKLNIFHTQPSAGKSTLLSQMAIHLASEVSFLFDNNFSINNRDSKGNIRPIIWAGLEEPTSKISKRFNDQIDTFIKMNYIKKEDKKDVLSRILIVNDDILTEETTEEGKIILPDLQNLVRAINPSVIFVDTFTAVCGSKGIDVSNMTGMGRVITPFQEIANLGVSTWLMCHNTKQEYDREMSSAQGNNSLQASAKLMLTMRQDKEKGKEYHILSITKSNDIERQKYSLRLDYPVFVCEGVKDGEIVSLENRQQVFIDCLKYADRLLPQFDNNLDKVCEQLNKEGKKTLLGCAWHRDNLRKSLKKLYEGKYGLYQR